MDYSTSLDLTILSILKEYSDKNNRITQRFIREELERRGIPVERRTLSRHLTSIISFFQENKHSGFGTVKHREKARTFKNKGTGEKEDNLMTTDLYYEGDFSENELHLLIDSVVFSKHVPNSDRKNIIKKIERIASGKFKTKSKFIEVVNTITSKNESILENINIIHTAINTETKIEFTYNDYGIDKKLHPTQTIKVNPYKIVAANDHYYLICKEESLDNYNHFRIDRITSIKLLEGNHFAPITSLNTSQYLSSHLYMLPGEAQHITINADEKIIGDIIDYFGDDFRIVNAENGELEIWIHSNLDDIYYWALQYGNHVEIIEPQELRDRLRNTVKAMSYSYLSTDEDKYSRAIEHIKEKSSFMIRRTNLKGKTFKEIPNNIKALSLSQNIIDNFDFLKRLDNLQLVNIIHQEIDSFSFLEKQKHLTMLTI